MATSVGGLARQLVLGVLLEDLTARYGGYELVAHWTQGEFHHDVVCVSPKAPPPTSQGACSSSPRTATAALTFASSPALWPRSSIALSPNTGSTPASS